MKFLALLIIPFLLFGCGTSFFLNKEPLKQLIVLTSGDQSIQLDAKSLIEDDIIRIQLVSEFYRGDAEIVYENGNYHIKYKNLPIPEDKVNNLKNDLYAAFYAGDYPFHSSFKMFGDVTLENNIKNVKDTDGYTLYKILYNGKEIRLYNIISQYTISVYSDKDITADK